MDDELDRTWWNEARAIAARQARGASDAADDLAQELALAALERGADVTRPGAWLERVGRNAEIDRWRVARRRRALAREIDAPEAAPDPEASVLARERRGALRGALAGLPRALRRAVLARFHAELPFEAVAVRLGTRAVTARTRVHRALAQLRARVGGLRALFVWAPGAQATALGLALIAGVARPALFPTAALGTAVAPCSSRAPARRLASAPSIESTVAVTPAQAPLPRAARVADPPARVVIAPAPVAVQRYSYDDDEVDGELARPDDVLVPATPPSHQESLIELRRHFVPEILKTLEDL
jgi:RNA polymerase sigma factor (sigma-70 family)